MNSGCAAALDRLQDFCFMAIKAANREPCTPPRSTLILTPAFVVYTELGIDPRLHCRLTSFSRSLQTILRIILDGTLICALILTLPGSAPQPANAPAEKTAGAFAALFSSGRKYPPLCREKSARAPRRRDRSGACLRRRCGGFRTSCSNKCRAERCSRRYRA